MSGRSRRQATHKQNHESKSCHRGPNYDKNNLYRIDPGETQSKDRIKHNDRQWGTTIHGPAKNAHPNETHYCGYQCGVRYSCNTWLTTISCKNVYNKGEFGQIIEKNRFFFVNDTHTHKLSCINISAQICKQCTWYVMWYNKIHTRTVNKLWLNFNFFQQLHDHKQSFLTSHEMKVSNFFMKSRSFLSIIRANHNHLIGIWYLLGKKWKLQMH